MLELGDLEKIGFQIELYGEDCLKVAPASRLTGEISEQIFRYKRYLVAELKRRIMNEDLAQSNKRLKKLLPIYRRRPTKAQQRRADRRLMDRYNRYDIQGFREALLDWERLLHKRKGIFKPKPKE